VNGFRGAAVFVKKGVKKDNPYSKNARNSNSALDLSKNELNHFPPGGNTTININST
jgi:hypothetical protein